MEWNDSDAAEELIEPKEEGTNDNIPVVSKTVPEETKNDKDPATSIVEEKLDAAADAAEEIIEQEFTNRSQLMVHLKPELIALCRERGMKTNGTKKHLVDRLMGIDNHSQAQSTVASASVRTEKTSKASSAPSRSSRASRRTATVPTMVEFSAVGR